MKLLNQRVNDKVSYLNNYNMICPNWHDYTLNRQRYNFYILQVFYTCLSHFLNLSYMVYNIDFSESFQILEKPFKEEGKFWHFLGTAGLKKFQTGKWNADKKIK